LSEIHFFLLLYLFTSSSIFPYLHLQNSINAMDPDPNSHPILSYVLSRLPPSLSFKRTQKTSSEFDIEQPAPPPEDPSAADLHGIELAERMPGLKDPAVLEAMSKAVAVVAQTRSMLQTLGPRPDHEAIDKARARIAELGSELSPQLEEIVLSSPHAEDSDGQQLRAEQVMCLNCKPIIDLFTEI
jgi:hypothetical protein